MTTTATISHEFIQKPYAAFGEHVWTADLSNGFRMVNRTKRELLAALAARGIAAVGDVIER
jgi:hypothetical protein